MIILHSIAVIDLIWISRLELANIKTYPWFSSFISQDIDFSWPPVCTAKEEVTFEVPLSIHQTSKPVETTFTLNTRFIVAKEEEVTLTRSQFPDNIAFDEGLFFILIFNSNKIYVNASFRCYSEPSRSLSNHISLQLKNSNFHKASPL